MEFLNWLSSDKNWLILVLTFIFIGVVAESIIRAWRGKD